MNVESKNVPAREDQTQKAGECTDATMTGRTLADDMIEGADEIAHFLGGGWTAARVYAARCANALPIRKKAGAGIYAFRSEL